MIPPRTKNPADSRAPEGPEGIAGAEPQSHARNGRRCRGVEEGVAAPRYHSSALRPSALLAAASDSAHATIRWKALSVRKRPMPPDVIGRRRWYGLMSIHTRDGLHCAAAWPLHQPFPRCSAATAGTTFMGYRRTGAPSVGGRSIGRIAKVTPPIPARRRGDAGLDASLYPSSGLLSRLFSWLALGRSAFGGHGIATARPCGLSANAAGM